MQLIIFHPCSRLEEAEEKFKGFPNIEWYENFYMRRLKFATIMPDAMTRQAYTYWESCDLFMRATTTSLRVRKRIAHCSVYL
jgi:hypothetical protein